MEVSWAEARAVMRVGSMAVSMVGLMAASRACLMAVKTVVELVETLAVWWVVCSAALRAGETDGPTAADAVVSKARLMDEALVC